ncbi:MAG: coiled-coil domain-containing protein [Thermoanaerobacteraceae bacterium]
MKKYLIFFLILLLLFSPFNNIYADNIEEMKLKEQEIIYELFNLEAEKIKAQRNLEDITDFINRLETDIHKKVEEINNIDINIFKERQIINTWFRFLYMEGTNTLLSILLMSDNSSQLLHRIIYIDIITNYFYNKLDNLNALIYDKKTEEKMLIDQKAALINRKNEQVNIIKKIDNLSKEKSLMLEDIKNKISDYNRIYEISGVIDKTMPSIDLLLNNLSNFPWSSLEPDELKFSFFSVYASFSDKTITKMIQNYNKDFKKVEVYFNQKGFQIKNDNNYTLEGDFVIKNENLYLNITSIYIGKIKIEKEQLKGMLSGYDMKIDIKSPIETFKLKSVETQKGFVKFVLGK